MRRTLFVILLAATLVATAAPPVAAAPSTRDYVRLVNPWVESDIGRFFFFQSASQPFGMVKLRPDTSTSTTWDSGYQHDENEVKGFSHVHEWTLSGVQVMPTTGAPVPKTQGDTGWQSHVDHDNGEIAEPGYHKLHLDRYGVTAELTSTERVGMHRYTYDRGGPSEIIVNLGGVLGEATMNGAQVTKVSNQELEGFVTMHDGNTKLFFDIAFDRPFDSLHGWTNGKLADGGAPIDRLAGDNMGVYVRYGQLAAGSAVQLKVALSYTSTEGARRNLAAELPGWSFGATKAAAQRQWNDLLGRIDVRGGTHQQQVKFYTDLFHVLCGRGVYSDADGKYIDDTWNHNQVKQIPLGRDGRPKFAMYNSDALWLTQWNVNSILGLAYPEIYASMVNSFLQMYRDGGLLPRGPAAGDDTMIMTGSPITSFIVGAWNKGIRGFDIDLAFKAMLDAQSVGGLFDKGAIEYGSWTGAGGIRPYLERGYVPHDQSAGFLDGGAGETLEYANQDWALGQLARQLHKRGLNVAQFAKVSVSSQLNDSNFAGVRAVDGRPIRSSVSPKENVEWASNGEKTPAITLSWDKPRTIQKVVLSDRANLTDNVNSGVLRFSDGSSVNVSGIPADGTEKTVQFGKRSVSWARFEATGGTGANVGLNEFEAWDDSDTGAYLIDRSRNWRNLLDPSTGFIRPKAADGSWLTPFDPLSGNDFVEANAWQATWFTSHDVMGLANLVGGEAGYADKLNYAFVRAEKDNFIGAYGKGYVSYGNQPGLEVAHLFNYVGKPWLTQYWVRQVQAKTYGAVSTVDGYGHHDEDQGQMGAMSALMAMGLFEVTGGSLADPVYDITSPVFDQTTIRLGSGREFRIVTHDNSAANLYIQRARLNGHQLDRSWFGQDQLARGGTLELWLGNRPNQKWGTRDLPPSASRSEGRQPVYANAVTVSGPDVVREPYGKTQFQATYTPANTTLKQAFWSVTEPDGKPTDKATIDGDGVLTVNHRSGNVLVTATAADGHRVSASRKVSLDLDVKLLRGNAARWPGVTATASSEYSPQYAAAKVHDGIIGEQDSGDWASKGEQNPWIELSWPGPIRTDRIVLYDRPGIDDVHGGTLTFSDGSTVAVTGVPTDGGPKVVTFGMKTIKSVRFQVAGGTGPNEGLSELEVHAVPSIPLAPAGITASADAGKATVSWKPPAFDGGAPLTAYVVTPYRDGVAQDPVTVRPDQTRAVLDGLVRGQSYRFTVAAVNMVGTGTPSVQSNPVTP
ncbi:glycoside hydrolase domain-containing protein [Fodinicola acaciae]|uniref:glycoside hydrolase domain-containing protein n=1 Tax=Fodinicola acaciae TaxID=2681555 RepID=UPI0013D68BEA|nr:glycoside hydrolase domain-containing protein [Fodinicola acaciae]